MLMHIRYEWHCLCDEMNLGVSKVNEKPGSVKLLYRLELNKFKLLQHVGGDEHDEALEIIDVNLAYSMMSCNKNVAQIKQRELNTGTWNFQCLHNDMKALEVGEILHKSYIDIIGGQKSWEVDNSKI